MNISVKNSPTFGQTELETRMKSLLWIFIIFSFTFSSMGTHIVGGDLHYECVGENQYYIVLNVYRDCQTGISDFDDPACVAVYNSNGILVMNVPMSLENAVQTDLPVSTGDPCLQAPEGLCVEKALYDTTITLVVPAGGLVLSYQRCCRNTTIINCESNDDIGMTLTTTIPEPALAVCNSNPAFIEFPPVIICLNEPFVFNHAAIDIDGDSLVYEFCNPLLENSNQGNYICPAEAPPYPLLDFYPQYSADYPLDADPAFAINSNTGLLTGTPIQIGKYVVGVCVSEYRNGVLLSTTNRDFQFNIAACSQDFISNIDPPLPCQGTDVTFGNNSQDATTYFWDFGDESTDADTSNVFGPSYSYPEVGIYDVTLIVNPGSQCADTSTVEIAVFNPIIVDITSVGPTCINGQWTYVFNAEGIYDDGMNFHWEFVEGNPSTSENENPPVIGYTESGVHDINLLVENGYCNNDALLSIDVPDLPVADIVPQTVFCGGLTITFENNSSNASTYLWDFGDMVANDSSTEENPTYTYGAYGTYNVTLIADPGSPCSYTDEQQFILMPPDPIEELYIIAEPDICDTVPRVNVLWYGTGASSLEWDFGDGSTSEESSTQYVYEDNGNYTVTLTLINELCDYEEVYQEDISIGFGPILAPLIVPNIFTPSGDHKNEHFRMFYQNEDLVLPEGRTLFDYMDLYHMKIYDRWGVLVFDSENDPIHMWDGDFNGPCSEGVYYYILEYRRKCLDDKNLSREGHLTLLRKTK